MAAGLMKQEIECMERILQLRRTEVNSSPKPNPAETAKIRLEISMLQKIESDLYKQELEIGFFEWFSRNLFHGEDQAAKKLRLKEISQKIRQLQKSLPPDRLFEDQTLPKFEKLCSEIKADLPKPETLVDIEEKLRLTNEEIIATVREYEKNFHADIAAMPSDYKPANVSGPPGMLNTFLQLVQLPVDAAGTQRVVIAFAGLKLYRFVSYSNTLQDLRDDHISGYLQVAVKWEPLKRKAEIRKKKNELAAIPELTLPNVTLFTINNFPLPDPFARQKLFLEEIIADLNAATAEEGPEQKKSREKDQCEARLNDLRSKRAAVPTSYSRFHSQPRQPQVSQYYKQPLKKDPQRGGS